MLILPTPKGCGQATYQKQNKACSDKPLGQDHRLAFRREIHFFNSALAIVFHSTRSGPKVDYDRRDEGDIHVPAIITTIDRQEGTRENVQAAGLRFEALFTKADLGVQE
ncbi:MAG: hypothetical protein IH985_06970 [Planctomycetes bacterium]|nr:hypothetical protein [Planctomycetota bacterium]